MFNCMKLAKIGTRKMGSAAGAPRPSTKSPSAGRGARPRLSLKPLRRLNLVQGVVEQLREQIVDASGFGPDGLLPSEGQLGQALGVSRTVIREAMRILSAQGLVEISQGRQPRTKPADPEAVVDTFTTYLKRGDYPLLKLIEVRCPLEAAIAALAAERASAAQIQEMKDSVDAMADARSLDRQIENDLRFHDLLVQASDNHVFHLLLKSVSELLYESRRATLSRVGVERAISGHRAILAAVGKRDPKAARRAMLKHLADAESDLRAQDP